MDYAALGQRVHQIRHQKGLMQAGLAEKVDVSTSFIGHIERGTRIISLETFARLCRVLETDAGCSEYRKPIWNRATVQKSSFWNCLSAAQNLQRESEID